MSEEHRDGVSGASETDVSSETIPEGILELEMTVWQLDDAQLKQALRIIGRELGRRGLGEYHEEEK
jgi:hypothetical protein